MIGASTCDKSHDNLSLRHGKLTNNVGRYISRSIASAVSQAAQRAVNQAPRRLPFTSTSVTSSSSATSISTMSFTSTSTSQELPMLMCSLVVRSCCISLETCLILKSDYIKQFFLCVCFCCPCWCFLQIDWCSSSYIKDVFGESPVLYTFAGWWPVCWCDEQKLIIDVFGVPHLFLSCCTASLVKEAACQLESYDYIYEGKRNFGPFAFLAHCVTCACLMPCQF